MQVNELEANGLKRKYQITVSAEALAGKKQEELARIGKTAKVAGFRVGKVPAKILDQMYGRSIQADVADKAIKDAVSDLLKEKNFRPAMTPQITIDEFNDGGTLVFSVAMELFPELPELEFSDIKIERNVFEITEKDIDDAAKRIAERSPKFVEMPKASKAEKGNVVKIDFKGSIDGVAFDGGSAENFELNLGSGQFIDGFEDQLVGAKAGDKRDVKVTFPAKYPASNLAGKEAVFEVTVHAVQKAETPEVNEEFAKERGFENLEALRGAIKDQLTNDYNSIVRNQLKKQLFDKLEEKFKFDLPETMVDMEFKTIWEKVKQSLAEGDEFLQGKSEAELEEEYKKVARRRVTLGILLAEFGNNEKIQVSREEVSRAVIQQAQAYPQQARQIFDFYQKNPQRLEDFRGPILEEKAVDLILTKVAFSDKKVALDELFNFDGEEGEAEGGAEKKAKKSTKKAAKQENQESLPL